MALSHPRVQTRIVAGIQQLIQKRLGAAVEVEQVDLAIPSKIVLRGLSMEDDQQEEFVSINELQLDILSLSFWQWVRGEADMGELTVRYIELDGVDFHLVKREDSVFNIDFLKGNQADSQRSSFPLGIIFPEVNLKNCSFHFRDDSHPEVQVFSSGTINFRNFHSGGIYGSLSLLYSPNSLEAKVNHLKAKETRTGFQMEEFQTLLKADPSGEAKGVEWLDLYFQQGDTQIQGDWYFDSHTLKEVFEDWVDIPSRFTLKDSKIDMETLSYFSSQALPVEGNYAVKGTIEGMLENWISRDLYVAYKDSTYAQFWMQMKDLGNDARPSTFDIRISKSEIFMEHLTQIVPQVELPFDKQALPKAQITGNMRGKAEEFILNLEMDSYLGRLLTIMQITPGDEKRGIPLQYSGYTKTEALNWDLLGVSPQLSSELLNLQAKVRGKGTHIGDLDTQLDVLITSSVLWDIPVDTLMGNVRVVDRKLSGLLNLRDEEGAADVTANLNLLDSPALYQVNGDLKDFSLQKFLGIEQGIDISGSLNLDLEGDSLENIGGKIAMQNMVMQRSGDSVSIQVPDLLFEALNNTPENKYIILRSDLLDAELAGNFAFKNALNLSSRLLLESRLFLENDTSAINRYYAEKEVDNTPVQVNLALSAKDSINALFNFLGESLEISTGGTLIGRFNFGRSERARITCDVDSFQIGPIQSKGLDADLDLLKYSNQNSLLVVGNISLDTVSVYPDLWFRDISLNVNGLDRVVGTDLVAFQGNSENRVQMKLENNFPASGRMVSSIDSRFTYFLFQGDSLRVNDYNTITYYSDQDRWKFEDFVLSGQRGILSIEGELSEDSSSVITADLENFALEHMQVFFPSEYDMGGMAAIHISANQLLGEGNLDFTTSVQDFAVNDFDYGALAFEGIWELKPLGVDISGSLRNEGKDRVLVSGSYREEEKESPLQIDIETEEGFPLDYISPFVEGQLYGLRGNVALDSFRIRGKPGDFDVNGVGHFENAKVGIDYFQSDYSFDAPITFNNNQIIFPRITLKDKYGNTADLHGNIYHRGLKEFEFDLQMDEIKDFLLIDTRAENNDLYYGKLYLKNGIASITGNLDQLDIQAYVMSGGGTQLKIPISFDEALEKPDFIHFVGANGITAGPPQVETGIKGFELNLSVQATPDATVELIFDEKVGDIIRMQGEGTIKFRVNEKGDFSMLGTYEIQEGDYLFTARNVLNKKFQVRPGGTISWTGDPYQGQVNLKAFYPLYADIHDLIQSDETRRVATNVLMEMQGSLLQPEIALSIEIPNLREQEALSIASLLRTIQYDEQELNKQVFSLMVFNRFAPVGGFLDENVANTGVSTSISELLSNQLNYWLSQALNDKVNVNVGTSNFQDVNLLISARLFNDRVRIERDGILLGPGNNGLEVGNIKIIIRLIRPDNPRNRQGELVLEVFNRESLDLTQQFTVQRGLGVFYKRNFDSLKELLTPKKPEKEEP